MEENGEIEATVTIQKGEKEINSESLNACVKQLDLLKSFLIDVFPSPVLYVDSQFYHQNHLLT